MTIKDIALTAGVTIAIGVGAYFGNTITSILKGIWAEIKNLTSLVTRHDEKIIYHTDKIQEHNELLKEHAEKLQEHAELLSTIKHSKTRP
jgi:uncharacterized membrane protein YhiD involved in acid resistance